MRFKIFACGSVLALCLGGCTNPYAKYYQPTTNGSVAFAPVVSEPRVVSGGGDARREVLNYFEEGYGLVGIASFSGPAQKQKSALAQAKKVHASVVVVTSHYRNTESGMMPMTLPTTSTAYSSGTVNAYGSGGYGYGSYSGTTTTYGTQTTYIPYSVDHYEQTALFFAPLERRGSGAYLDKMTDEQRRVIGSNLGLQIVAVRKGSPVFKADIVPGDVVTSIGGAPVYDFDSYRQAVAAVHDATVEVIIFRGGNRLVKNVAAEDTW